MNLAATIDGNWPFRAGHPILVRRTDGSNRIHHATCTDVNHRGIGFVAKTVFVVGEVVELLIGHGEGKEAKKHRARVLFRMRDRYGLGLLAEHPAQGSPQLTSTERLEAARKLLTQLKTSYEALPEQHRQVIRNTLCEHGRKREAAA
jgi:hypothetical protein